MLSRRILPRVTAVVPQRSGKDLLRLSHFHPLYPVTVCAFSTTATADTEAATSSSPPSSSRLSLRQLVQPFILKCHPDMAKQQNLSAVAQQINLRAIQTLNMYLDGIRSIEKKEGRYPFPSSSSSSSSSSKDQDQDQQNGVITIEFVMAFPSTSSRKKTTPTTSRRTVELQVPSPHASIPNVQRHAQLQLRKLLHMAGLPLPQIMMDDEIGMDDEEEDESSLDHQNHHHHHDQDPSTGTHHRRTQTRKKTKWEQSRDRFMSQVDWTKFDQLYKEAIADMNADIATTGSIRNHPERRRRLLATILQNIRVSTSTIVSAPDDDNDDDTDDNIQPNTMVVPDVEPLEELVALRRIYRLIDQHFDELQLETFGRYWESLTIVLQGKRLYNTSTSALYKRRQRKQDTGFSFHVHSDNTVTIHIPVDFYEQELLEELDRNVWDFYYLMKQQQQENNELERMLFHAMPGRD